jgi:NADPH:quinone reductase-like Zn-dependent oxidoreductase
VSQSEELRGLQIRSRVTQAGEVEISLIETTTPAPGPDEVVVRVEATPINPSDLGLFLAGADTSTLEVVRTTPEPMIRAKIPAGVMKAMAGRLGESLPVGNEGAGVVVAAGTSPAAQALMGKTVAIIAGAMYSQYRSAKAADCLVLPEGATAAAGASAFVNPLTALGMTETMRMEGHKALVHTAAASNLGQMLNRICLADRIDLVNIVRDAKQETLLRELGALHVCVSSAPSFLEDLTRAIEATGATLGFDAIGGGPLAGQILGAMEVAAARSAKIYSRYGSSTHKQVYIYGGLDTGPTELRRSFGMAWGLGGWLLFPFLQKAGPETVVRLRRRVVDELDTTFASHYARVISLHEALDIPTILEFAKRATGEKYLIDPSKGI